MGCHQALQLSREIVHYLKINNRRKIGFLQFYHIKRPIYLIIIWVQKVPKPITIFVVHKLLALTPITSRHEIK